MNKKKTFLMGGLATIVTLLVMGALVPFTAFNTNQFSTNSAGTIVSIKSGTAVTNPSIYGAVAGFTAGGANDWSIDGNGSAEFNSFIVQSLSQFNVDVNGNITSLGTTNLTGWSILPTNSLTGFVKTNDSRPNINITGALSIANTNNVLGGSFISPQISGNASTGRPFISNGVFGFIEDYPSYYMWNNLTHGSRNGNNHEIQWNYNQMFLGPEDGNRTQYGLGSQTNVLFCIQYANTNGSPSDLGHSHEFGWDAAYRSTNAVYFINWNTWSQVYNTNTGAIRLQFFAPTFNPNDTGIERGNVAFDIYADVNQRTGGVEIPGWLNVSNQVTNVVGSSVPVATSFTAHDSTTNYIVDFNVPVVKVTPGNAINFVGSTNNPPANVYKSVQFQFKGSGSAFTLTFGNTNWTVVGTGTTTNYTLGNSNGWWTVAIDTTGGTNDNLISYGVAAPLR